MAARERQGEQTGRKTAAQRPGRYLQLETTARDGSQDRNESVLGVCPVDAGCWQGGDDGLGGAVRCLGPVTEWRSAARIIERLWRADEAGEGTDDLPAGRGY